MGISPPVTERTSVFLEGLVQFLGEVFRGVHEAAEDDRTAAFLQ